MCNEGIKLGITRGIDALFISFGFGHINSVAKIVIVILFIVGHLLAVLVFIILIDQPTKK